MGNFPTHHFIGETFVIVEQAYKSSTASHQCIHFIPLCSIFTILNLGYSNNKVLIEILMDHETYPFNGDKPNEGDCKPQILKMLKNFCKCASADFSSILH